MYQGYVEMATYSRFPLRLLFIRQMTDLAYVVDSVFKLTRRFTGCALGEHFHNGEHFHLVSTESVPKS